MSASIDFDMINQPYPRTSKINAVHGPNMAPSSTGRPTDNAASTFVFTKKRLDQLPLPQTGRSTYKDAGQRNLQLRVYPSGQKTFQLRYSFNRRAERIYIGPYPDLSIEQARDEARKLLGERARGENPADERRALRDEMTFEELFNLYLEKHAKVHKRTWKEDEANYNRYLTGLSQRKISTITRFDSQTLHVRIGKDNGQTAANRTITLLAKVFNCARDWNWQGENPASRIKKFKETKRERFLQVEELPAFFRSLDEEWNITIRDYVLMSLLTGQRRANVLSMRWDEIRWGREIWEIPADKFKSGRQKNVELTPPAYSLLTFRKNLADADPVWVFPGRRGGHLQEPKTGWERILKRAGIENCRLHDLRHTQGSYQAINNASLIIIGKSLGHQSLQSTERYAHLISDPVRESMERANAAILAAAKVPKGLLPVLTRETGRRR